MLMRRQSNMKKPNQNEESLNEFLIILVAITILILVLIILALYAINASTSLALSLYVAASLLFVALVLYIDRKATMYERGGK